MATILQITSDYPDVLAGGKTRAIANLIEGVPQHRHVIYSLNRIDGLGGIEPFPSGEDCTAIIYGALPKGIFWNARFKALAKWILSDLREKGIAPDVIHGHKITVEGVIGHYIAEELKKPLICSMHGDTDLKVFEVKRSMRPLFRRIAQESSSVLAGAPWTIDFYAKHAGLDRSKAFTTPVIPGIHGLQTASPVGNDRLVSIFHLDSWRRKNLDGMARALGKLAATRPNIRLDVWGAGKPKTMMDIRRTLETIPGHERIDFRGPIKHAALTETLRQYVGFVLPSKRETYGMVYAESLFNGLPVVFSRNWGIDGYFDAAKIGYAADAHSVDDIARGMAHLLDHETALKISIAAMQQAGQLAIIERPAIIQTYSDAIDRALAA